MYRFMNHIINSLLVIIIIGISNAQVVNNRFYEIYHYQYKNNHLNVSRLCSPEYIRKHFLNRDTYYRLELHRLPNMIQIHYRMFPLDDNNNIVMGSAVTFNVRIDEKIIYIKPNNIMTSLSFNL